jgi:alpha-maltose-1-phosphate synthase
MKDKKEKKIFLISGPGHHSKFIQRTLTKLKFFYTYTNFWPKFEFGRNNCIKKNLIFDSVVSILYALKKISFLRIKISWLNEQVYRTYSFFAASYIEKSYNIIWGFQMVSLKSFIRSKSKGNILLLEYAMTHIDTYMKIMEEEYLKTRFNGERSNKFSIQMIKILKKEIELADRINVLSSFAKDSFLENGIRKDKIHVTPLSVDTNVFLPKKKLANIGNSYFKILFVGRIEYLKGVHYLLEAIKKLNLKDVYLSIVGNSTPETEHLLYNYKELNNIEFLGQKNKEELVEIYNTHDVLILPSIQESFGLVILEAMSCGVPVIATENTGASDIISDGIDGFIIPIRDPDKIAEKIIFLKENKGYLFKMKQKAREKVLSFYTLDHYEKRVKNLIAELE